MQRVEIYSVGKEIRAIVGDVAKFHSVDRKDLHDIIGTNNVALTHEVKTELAPIHSIVLDNKQFFVAIEPKLKRILELTIKDEYQSKENVYKSREIRYNNSIKNLETELQKMVLSHLEFNQLSLIKKIYNIIRWHIKGT